MNNNEVTFATVVSHELPDAIYGVSFRKHSTGEWYIMINDKLSGDQYINTLRHEELHFLLGHFERDLDVWQCEYEVHSILEDFDEWYSGKW